MVTIPLTFQPKSEEITNEYQSGDADLPPSNRARCESRDCGAHVTTDTDTDTGLNSDYSTDNGKS